jgi:hypothetical protein
MTHSLAKKAAEETAMYAKLGWSSHGTRQRSRITFTCEGWEKSMVMTQMSCQTLSSCLRTDTFHAIHLNVPKFEILNRPHGIWEHGNQRQHQFREIGMYCTSTYKN